MISYTIKRSNGDVYVTIPNNVVYGPQQPNENPVPINLVGRNKVGYGQAYNENFLWLAENFASSSAPAGAVPGQLWYRNTTGSTGELLIALVDSASQPTDTTTEAQWASVPMITTFNTVPDGSESIMGRMVLTNNGDSLRVLMKDKEWREIQTTRPQNKQYEALLDINYDDDVTYVAFTQSNATKPIAYFNLGGAAITDDSGVTVFGDNSSGAFMFGSNYMFELKIIARQVSISSGTVVSIPGNYKTWIIKGQYYTNNNGGYTIDVTEADELPDPRQIASLTQIKDVMTSTQDTWDMSMVINGVDTSISGGSSTDAAGYESYVTSALNSTKHLGFRLDASVSGLASGQNTYLQFSAYLELTGIPPLGV